MAAAGREVSPKEVLSWGGDLGGPEKWIDLKFDLMRAVALSGLVGGMGRLFKIPGAASARRPLEEAYPTPTCLSLTHTCQNLPNLEISPPLQNVPRSIEVIPYHMALSPILVV